MAGPAGWWAAACRPTPAPRWWGVFDRPVELWFGATQGYESMHFWDERMKLETVGMPLELAAARLPELGAGADARPGRLRPRWPSGASSCGRAPRAGCGAGRWAAPPSSYDLTDEDVRTFKLGDQAPDRDDVRRRRARGLPGRARPARPHPLAPTRSSAIFALPDDPRLLHSIAAHLFGTARMGRDARSSVVGPELEAHDLPGLYVFDSSVFPSNIGVNPQHTISAVSWLAAERLADRLARS